MTFSDWIAVIAAGSALLTFWAMLATARRQLRAYIGIGERREKAERQLFLQSDGSIKALSLATNFGQTPAHNVFVKGFVGWGKVPLTEDFPCPELEFGKGGSLFPGDDLAIDSRAFFPSGTRMTQQQWLGTQPAIGALETWHVYGFITYEDVYGARRYTRFCYSIWWNDGPGTIPGWYSTGRFNETDASNARWWHRLFRYLMP